MDTRENPALAGERQTAKLVHEPAVVNVMDYESLTDEELAKLPAYRPPFAEEIKRERTDLLEAMDNARNVELHPTDDTESADGPLANIMRRRMGRFLDRVNYALADAAEHLTNFDIQAVYVSATVDISGNVSFPLGVGGGLGYSRSFEFILIPKKKDLPHETVSPTKASVDRDERLRWSDAGD